MRDEHWMQQALSLAERAFQEGEVPVGAVVVRDDVCLGEGWNAPIGRHDPSAHAEIAALRNAAETAANYRLPGATLYVTIEPCTMCLGAIVHARISRVVYGAKEPKAGVLDSHPIWQDRSLFNHAFEYCGGVCEAACSDIIQRFFQKRRQEKRASKPSDE